MQAFFHEGDGDIQHFVEHMKVAANAGDQVAMDDLMKTYKEEVLSKDDLTKTLRAFQASRDETKSKDRDNAKAMTGMASRLGVGID